MRLPRKVMAPAARTRQPMMERTVVVLPIAVAAEQGDRLAFFYPKVKLEKDLALRHSGLEIPDLSATSVPR